jgi:ribosomal protein L37AE/L43A
MLPLGGPEFWLQAELQDAMDRLIKIYFRDVLAMPRSPYPRLELSSRMTSSAGRCYPDTGVIRLAHWAARWRHGRRIAPHGREFRTIAHELDPRITITCPPFAQKERAQRRTWHMVCPRCRRTYRRARRDKVACRNCCDTYAGGQYDRRFRLTVVSRAE